MWTNYCHLHLVPIPDAIQTPVTQVSLECPPHSYSILLLNNLKHLQYLVVDMPPPPPPVFSTYKPCTALLCVHLLSVIIVVIIIIVVVAVVSDTAFSSRYCNMHQHAAGTACVPFSCLINAAALSWLVKVKQPSFGFHQPWPPGRGQPAHPPAAQGPGVS